ncbi:MAG: type 4 pilus major pilin [Alphaproteobacteria bacterium]|nr:type 4 pilus major pilin [Alphaproteobacteria bacterium]
MKKIKTLKLRFTRAFTLTELALVLGVLGVVLGSVWVAAGSVMKGSNLKLAADNAWIVLDNMHQLFSSRSSMPGYTGANVDRTASMVSSGVFPRSIINQTTNLPRNSWSGGFWIDTGSTSSTFRMYMDRVPSGDCIKFIASALNANGLSSVYTSTGWIAINNITPLNFTCPATCPQSAAGGTGVACIGMEFSLWYAPM